MPDIGMGDQHLRLLLEDRGDFDERDVFLNRRERLQQIAGHVELRLAGQHQRTVRRLRSALHDGDLQPVFLIGAVGDRLVEAAMLGLRQPVRAEADFVERQRLPGAQKRDRTSQRAQQSLPSRSHHVIPLFDARSIARLPASPAPAHGSFASQDACHGNGIARPPRYADPTARNPSRQSRR